MTPRSISTLLAIATATALGIIAPASARADLSVTVQSVIVAPNSTGNSFDVTLTNTGPSAVSVGGFSFEITTTAAGINFTSATTATTIDPYVFAGHSLFGPTINTTSGSTLDASDNYDVQASGITLAAGATVGLGHVFFDIGTTSGTVTLTPAPATSVSDAGGHNLPISSYVGGTITFSSVPEPSSVLCVLAALPAMAWIARRARPSPRATPLASR